jgi:archaellum component FlaF (FlaF/FlaG flagellin family)
MTTHARNSIDVNTVLRVLNLLVAALIVYGIPYAARDDTMRSVAEAKTAI